MFKRIIGLTEGVHDLKIVGVEVVDYKNSGKALKLNVRNEKGIKHTFLIFLNNIFLVNKLIESVYTDVTDNDEEFNEQDFIGITIKADIKETNGYLNIVDILNEPFYEEFDDINI